MNTLEVQEVMLRAINQGYNSSDKKPDDNYIFSMLPMWRSQAIDLLYNGGKIPNSNTIVSGTKFVHADWRQSVDYTIIPSEQNPANDYIQVTGYPIINIGTNVDGMGYFGTKATPRGFWYARSLGEIEQLKTLGHLKVKPAVMISGSLRLIYGNKLLEELHEESIFQNPYQSGWNYTTDKFPIDEKGVGIMKEFCIASMRTEFKGAVKDTISDNGNEQQAAQKQGIVI